MEKQVASTSTAEGSRSRKRELSNDVQGVREANFQSLPAELKVKIFENLSTPRDFMLARAVSFSDWGCIIAGLTKFPSITAFVLDFQCIDKSQHQVFGRSNIAWQYLILKNADNKMADKLTKNFGATEEQCAAVVSVKLKHGVFTWYALVQLLVLFPNLEELALIKCAFILNEFDKMEFARVAAILAKRTLDYRPIFKKLRVLELDFAYMGELQFMLKKIQDSTTSLHAVHLRFEPCCEVDCPNAIVMYAEMFNDITGFICRNSGTLRTLGVHFNNVSNWASYSNQVRIQQLLDNKQLMDTITTFGALQPPVRKLDKGYHSTYLQSSNYIFHNNDYEVVNFAMRLKNLQHFNCMVKLYRTCSTAYMTMLISPEINNKIRYLYVNLGCQTCNLKWFDRVEHLELYCGHCNPYHNSKDVRGTLAENWPASLAVQFSEIKYLHMVRPRSDDEGQGRPLHVIDFAFVQILAKYMAFLVSVHIDCASELTDASFVCDHKDWSHTQNGREDCSRFCSLPNLEDLKLKLLRRISGKAITHGFKFPKLKRLTVTGMPVIDPEVIMTISTNNPGLEECKLRWEAGKEGLLTRQQWTTYWKRFRNNLVFIQQRKLKLEHNKPKESFDDPAEDN